ncbi:MAG TPA: hypothetical protein PK657_07345 [Legionella sp.]|nr:hypothetical protein [Legionella sp.]
MPEIALKMSDLKPDSDDPIKGSFNNVKRITFIEDGIEKVGFFKAISNKYPEFLAKMCVATACCKQLQLGKQTAEERLVYDGDKIVGTLSIAIDGFKPLNCYNPDEQEKVSPSTQTLLDKNFLLILFIQWYYCNDDAHPGNMGFSEHGPAELDNDMFFYWFTHLIKPRNFVSPVRQEHIKVHDYERFPDINIFYHWCTYDKPGNNSNLPEFVKEWLPKKFADPAQFLALASSKEAVEQTFAAGMRCLMTYQPNMLMARLKKYLGDTPWDYTSLEASVAAQYENKFPDLCNELTNKEPFINSFRKIYQKGYDNLYRVMVLYMGNPKNSHGLSIPATCLELYDKPSYFKRVQAWTEHLNNTLFVKDSINEKFDNKVLKARYNQIWRDTFAPRFTKELSESYNLLKSMMLDVSAPKDHAAIQDIFDGNSSSWSAEDSNLTFIWQVFQPMTKLSIEQLRQYVRLDLGNKRRDGILGLINFTNQLYEAASEYYNISSEKLIEDHNSLFIDKIAKITHYNEVFRICELFDHTTTFSTVFKTIVSSLELFIKQANIREHLVSTDDLMRTLSKKLLPEMLLPHTDEKVINQFVEDLFSWADSKKPEDLRRIIVDIIDTIYSPTINLYLLSTRTRGEPVKKYLVESNAKPGSHRLAYILKSGSTENGALNKALIEHLTVLMLEVKKNNPSLQYAVSNNLFKNDIDKFTLAAVSFAKTSPKFNQLELEFVSKLEFSENNKVQNFFDSMYLWLNKLPRSKFTEIINNAKAEYKKGLSRFSFFSSREAKVDEYCKTIKEQDKIVAYIFYEGDVSSTLNKKLLQTIISAIKKDGAGLASDFTYIKNLDPLDTDHELFKSLLNSLKSTAEPYTHKQEPGTLRKALTS